MKSFPAKSALVGFLLILGFGSASRAAVVLSNLDQAILSTSPLATGFWFGNRFVTGSSGPFTLESVTLSLGAPSNTSSGLFVSIFSDGSSQPAMQMEALSGPFAPTVAGDYAYTSTGLNLAANTSYWLVAGVASGAGSYAWDVTDSNSFTGSWTLPATATHIYSFNQGGQWEPAQNGFPRQFSIAATAVPEPSGYAFLAVAGGAWFLRRGRRKAVARAWV